MTTETTTPRDPREDAKWMHRHRRLVKFTVNFSGDLIERDGMVLRHLTDEGFSYSPWRNENEPMAHAGYIRWEYLDGNFQVDTDAEEIQRQYRYSNEHEAAKQAVRAIETAVNGSTGGMDGFREGIQGVHPTLLGKIFNVIMEVAKEREGDGRLVDINGNLAEKARILGDDALVSDVRQRFI